VTEVTTERFGPLRYRLVAPTKSPQFAIVLCHGYGAPGDDLVAFADAFLRLEPRLADEAIFAFPEAPLSLGGVGPWEARAWWPIDIEALERALAEGRSFAAGRAAPDGLPEARAQLAASLEPFCARFALGTDRCVLGGFSQGAMIATDLGLRLSPAPLGLALFSGTLLTPTEWRPLAATLAASARVPWILQSHGRQDSLLSFGAATALRDLLVEAGLAVEFVAFDGPHTIPPEALDRCARLLAAHRGSRP